MQQNTVSARFIRHIGLVTQRVCSYKEPITRLQLNTECREALKFQLLFSLVFKELK